MVEGLVKRLIQMLVLLSSSTNRSKTIFQVGKQGRIQSIGRLWQHGSFLDNKRYDVNQIVLVFSNKSNCAVKNFFG